MSFIEGIHRQWAITPWGRAYALFCWELQFTKLMRHGSVWHILARKKFEQLECARRAEEHD